MYLCVREDYGSDISYITYLEAPNNNSFIEKADVETETKTKLNSVALVSKRTIPTERPPLVGEVIANFCG
jgi:hypothetical protein